MEPTKSTRSFRINDDLWELMKKEAERRGSTASALVQLAITEHITGVMKKESGVTTVDLIKLIGGLEQQSEKITAQLNEAKQHITGQGANS
tara:strand:- start:3085 stop:3357 length:273 start_codon:yes stop_codon:yes gene_type:complete